MLQYLIQFCYAANPLAGLSPEALRLYSALEVFKNAEIGHSVGDDHSRDWFRAPNRDKRLKTTGFSKAEIDRGLDELLKAGVLEIRNKRRTLWYHLK
ncbi:MAG: hypothetical protein OXN17_16070 [Candidatus Poribacteria bacterium]|nr:hypothetical protein [Candidatus Poribacteria bacterium]